jgi:hypothetical protein
MAPARFLKSHYHTPEHKRATRSPDVRPYKRFCGRIENDLRAHHESQLPPNSQLATAIAPEIAEPCAEKLLSCHPERSEGSLEKKIALREGKDFRGLAGNGRAIHGDFVGFWIDVNIGRGAIVQHVFLADFAAVLHGRDHFLQVELLRHARLQTRL